MSIPSTSLSLLLHAQQLDQKTFELSCVENQNITIVDDIRDVSLSPLTITLARNAILQYELRSVDELAPSNQVPLERTLVIRLAGEGASAHIRVSVATYGAQVVKLKTVQHHLAPHTTSHMVIKGVLFGESRLVSDNLIRIEPQAQHTKAREENKNLILGDHARVVSIPKIEVEADQVSCEHGAAVSRISEQDLFYLQSRGLELEQAQQMLIDAFLQV